MNSYPWHIAVLIPARNEEELIGHCLSSVLTACASVHRFATTDVVVAVDSSTDGTARIARELLSFAGTVAVTEAGSVGAARSLAAHAALLRSRVPLNRCWLANTDADCIVDGDWLLRQLQLAAQGVAAIAGTVSVSNFDGHGPEVAQRFQSSYVIHADRTHPHIHGANLGVRADTYCRSGGWSELRSAEDHDLWNRLLRSGVECCSTSLIEVSTSGRRVGRAPHGFANALAAHNDSAS